MVTDNTEAAISEEQLTPTGSIGTNLYSSIPYIYTQFPISMEWNGMEWFSYGAVGGDKKVTQNAN